MRSHYLILLVLSLFFSSCIKVNKPKPVEDKYKNYSQKLIEINRYLVKKDQEIIADYVKHKGWNMQRDSTGLWYEILVQGTGPYPKDGDEVVIDYRVELLNGKLCYSSDSLGEMSFKVNHSNVIRGLNDGVQKLRVGGKGRFIIPPYLGYGLLGDQKCIPPRSIILYYITLKSIK